MSWLKSIGQALAKVFQVVQKVEPIVQTVLASFPPTAAVAAGLSVFESIFANIEGIVQSPNSGTQKLAMAIPLVEQQLQAFLGNRVIADQQKYAVAVKNWSSAFVDILNSLEAPAITPAG